MCLAVPARIEALLPDQMATVNLGGVRLSVSLALIDAPAVGDYVIVHVGFALTKLDLAEAERTLELLAEAGQVALTEARSATLLATPALPTG